MSDKKTNYDLEANSGYGIKWNAGSYVKSTDGTLHLKGVELDFKNSSDTVVFTVDTDGNVDITGDYLVNGSPISGGSLDLSALTAKTTPVDADLTLVGDSAASFANKKVTWANIKATLKTYFDSLYESLTNKDATGGYAGLTLFKINFKNAANTFTSFFTNTNTAARTYTFQDRDGTIIDNTNLVTGSTDNAILRANGTGGATTQSSGVTIDDNGKIETPSSIKITANTSFVSSDGPKIYKASDLGMVIQGVTGTTSSVCFVTPTGTRLMENPNGTTNLVSGPTGIINYYLGYSTMTANNPTFYVYGWDSGSSSTKYGQLKTLSTGSFQILAQSGENLELGANAATIMHLSSGQVGIGGTPNSTLQVSGSVATAYVAKTGAYTLTATDYTVDCTSGTFAITLPTAASITGRIYVINNSGSGTITINTTSSQTINGAASGTITLAQYHSLTVQSDGANWIKIAAI